MEISPVDFAETLAAGLYCVEFEKADGSLRRMTCTRSPELIPADCAPKSNTPVLETATAVPVFDVEISQWRSIRPDFVKSMEIA